MNEKLRRFVEYLISRSGRGLKYWESLPPYRVADHFMSKVKELVDCLTDGQGDLNEISLDIAFMAFMFFERGASVQEIVSRVKNTGAVERMAPEEADLDRKKWEMGKDKTPDKPTDYWRG
jgi:hypothetical protein